MPLLLFRGGLENRKTVEPIEWNEEQRLKMEVNNAIAKTVKGQVRIVNIDWNTLTSRMYSKEPIECNWQQFLSSGEHLYMS
jgi:hypothetical protein